MISVWGVDHGEEVSKMTQQNRKRVGTAMVGAGALAGTAGTLANSAKPAVGLIGGGTALGLGGLAVSRGKRKKRVP